MFKKLRYPMTVAVLCAAQIGCIWLNQLDDFSFETPFAQWKGAVLILFFAIWMICIYGLYKGGGIKLLRFLSRCWATVLTFMLLSWLVQWVSVAQDGAFETIVMWLL